MGPCKKEKNMSGDIAWQISHPWTTGMGLQWHKDGRGDQQTAWHINHLSPMGHKLYEKTQVAERHMLAGSVTTERSPEISSSFCRMWDKKRNTLCLHTNSQRAISMTRKTETAWQNSSLHPLSFQEKHSKTYVKANKCKLVHVSTQAGGHTLLGSSNTLDPREIKQYQ